MQGISLCIKYHPMKKIITALCFAALLSPAFATAQTEKTAKAQCTAITKAGTRCTRKAQPNSEFCKQHDPNSLRCGAITKSGKPCNRVVKVAGTHCKQHSK